MMQIIDKVYGKEHIKEPLLEELINSKTIQRLKKISQYGVPDGYYHKKNYSRYNHSIGVFVLLRKLGADLEEQIAGLLHDASHTAFSHVVDWVIGNSTQEDYQDISHLNFIKSSEIPSILNKYRINYEKVSDLENFTLLERPSPSLCVDRIDYTLRELSMDGKSKLARKIVRNLINKDGQVVFSSKEFGEKFANEYLRLQKEHWAGKQAVVRYHILAEVLKKALEKKLITFEELYKTDFEVIGILKKSRDADILKNLNLLKNNLIIEENFSGEGIVLKKKFRYIDPEIFINGGIEKLSDISKEYFNILEKEKQNSTIERRFIYRT